MSARDTCIKVLIVGSPLIREWLVRLLAAQAGVEVAGEAPNGDEGARLAFLLRPDLIIMAIEMPARKGLEAIEAIMQRNPTPILVLTSYSNAGLAYEAISRGALEVVVKPKPDLAQCRQFVRKIKLLAGVSVIRHIKGSKPAWKNVASGKEATGVWTKVVAIASSLGGANVLETIFSRLPAGFPAPIVVAQHISAGFAEALADWLNHKTPLTVKVASGADVLTPGSVFIAPPEYNIEVDATGKLTLAPCPAGHIYHPSCDRLLTSVACAYRERAVGIILTGMGQDGVAGMAAIKAAGGVTIAQNEQTSLIYNMPRLVIERGLADFVVAAADISTTLTSVVSG